jgi:hypothetical protein
VGRNERLARLIDDTALEVSFRISTAQYARLIGEDGSLPQVPVRVVLDVFGLDLAADAVLTRESGSVGEGQSGRVLFARIEDARGLASATSSASRWRNRRSPVSRAFPRRRWGRTAACWCWARRIRLAAEVVLMRRQGDDVLVSVPPELAGREVVAARTPVLGEGIRVNPFRRDADGQAEAEAPRPSRSTPNAARG